MSMNNIDVIAIIPARLGSTRLPAKPLMDIVGKPLIIRTCECVMKSDYIKETYVATDSLEIKNICEQYEIKALMTSVDAKSGTDRIYEAVNKYKLKADYILNVQGDEPLINPKDIDDLILGFTNSNSDAATLVTEIKTVEELFNPNVVKVVFNNVNDAIYFSRSVIPFVRDSGKENIFKKNKFYKHIGIYLFKNETLEYFVNEKQSKLELSEKLEQLRLIENGKKIYCHEIFSEIQGVDTAEDLEKVRKIYKNSQKNDLHK